MRLFVDTNGSDIWQRLCYFVLAQLHPPRASTEYLESRIHNVVKGDVHTIRTRLHKMLWRGRQWLSVVETIQQVCKELCLPDISSPSVICIVKNLSR